MNQVITFDNVEEYLENKYSEKIIIYRTSDSLYKLGFHEPLQYYSNNVDKFMSFINFLIDSINIIYVYKGYNKDNTSDSKPYQSNQIGFIYNNIFHVLKRDGFVKRQNWLISKNTFIVIDFTGIG